MIERAVQGLTRRQCLQNMAFVFGGLALVPGLAQAPRDMRVGFIKRYKPYSFVAGGAPLQGFDVDVVQAVLASMSVTMVPVADTLVRLQAMLAKGEIDFIGNQLLYTPQNRRRFDFVVPYASIQLVAVLHESDDRDFLRLGDMLGRKLGVLAKTRVADQAREALGKSVRSFDRIDLALKALAAEELDVVLGENLIVEYHIEQDQLPLKVGAPMAAPLRVGLAVPKGQKIIQDQLSSAVRGVLMDKAFKSISNKWFGYNVSRPRMSYSEI